MDLGVDVSREDDETAQMGQQAREVEQLGQQAHSDDSDDSDYSYYSDDNSEARAEETLERTLENEALEDEIVVLRASAQDHRVASAREIVEAARLQVEAVRRKTQNALDEVVLREQRAEIVMREAFAMLPMWMSRGFY